MQQTCGIDRRSWTINLQPLYRAVGVSRPRPVEQPQGLDVVFDKQSDSENRRRNKHNSGWEKEMQCREIGAGS